MTELLKSPVGRLRIISILEGISWLILLCVAMPLKYGWGIKIAVTIAGGMHGMLFLLLLACLVQAAEVRRWTWGFIGIVIAAALIPAGAFWLEYRLRREEQV